jgi:hypothetical protein
MKRADGAIIAALLAICAIMFLLLNHGGQKNDGRMSAEIHVEGRLASVVPLPGGAAREIAVAGGKLVLSVEQDGVAVVHAECPSQTCARAGKITRPGQMIACLPNRVVIKLVGGEALEREVDVIAG